MFRKSARQTDVLEPLDWTVSTCPQRWRINGEEVRFDFFDQGAERFFFRKADKSAGRHPSGTVSDMQGSVYLMAQNIYDDPTFFASYIALRQKSEQRQRNA